MDPKKKSNSSIPPHVNEKIIRMDERLEIMMGILFRLSDQLTEIKYLMKSQNKNKNTI